MVSLVYGFMGRRVAVAPFLAWGQSWTSKQSRKPAIPTGRRTVGRAQAGSLQRTSTTYLKSGHCTLGQGALRATALRTLWSVSKSGHLPNPSTKRWALRGCVMATFGSCGAAFGALACCHANTSEIDFGGSIISCTIPFRESSSFGRTLRLNFTGGSGVVSVEWIWGRRTRCRKLALVAGGLLVLPMGSMRRTPVI